ncbi:MAG: dynamin family protein [Bacteroidota bacterium]
MCDFITGILSRYPWEPERKELLQSSLDKILTRKNDEKLYLGIIGEFSSGKTTFLNTLLQCDFLKTHATQGTTLITTFIEYGETIELLVDCHDGGCLSYSQDREELMRWGFPTGSPIGQDSPSVEIGYLVRALTTDSRNAGIFKKIRLYYPSPILRKGIVLIDTPGIDSVDESHLQVTSRAIREDCDLAVIMVPSGLPFSQTLQDFLTSYIPDNLHRCLYLLTKTELLRNSTERELVLTNVTTRLSAFLKVRNIKVYPAPTLLALEEAQLIEKTGLLEKIPAEERKRLVEEYQATMAEIFQQLSEKKQLVLTERLISLTNSLLVSLDHDLRAFEASCTREKINLESNRIPDIEAYTAARQALFHSHLQQQTETCLAQLQRQVEAEQEGGIRYFSSRIDNADSKRGLAQAIDSAQLDYYVNKSLFNIGQDLNRRLAAMTASYQKLYGDFEEEFLQRYKSLALLENNHTVPTVGSDQRIMQQLTGSSLYSNDIARMVNQSMNEGMGLGLEKVTTVIDDFFGKSVSSDIENAVEKVFNFFGVEDLFVSTTTLRQKVRASTIDRIREYYAGIMEKVRGEFRQEAHRLYAALSDTAIRYMTVYRKLVDERIGHDKLRGIALEELRKKTGKDQQLLKKYTGELEQLAASYKKQ